MPTCKQHEQGWLDTSIFLKNYEKKPAETKLLLW